MPFPNTSSKRRAIGAALGAGFRGPACFSRRFGLPTGLEPATRVWLVFEHVDGEARLALNGNPLGAIPLGQRSARFDVTTLLQERNLLAVEVELREMSPIQEQELRRERAGLPGGMIGETRLEIAPG